MHTTAAENRQGKPAACCAGGDIRFFHHAALAGDAALGDFFTEEDALNHRIHRHLKPIVALMDGVVMGGGMGLGQGATAEVVFAMVKRQAEVLPPAPGLPLLDRISRHFGRPDLAGIMPSLAVATDDWSPATHSLRALD
jgi:enoyl-CoA hydratase